MKHILVFGILIAMASMHTSADEQDLTECVMPPIVRKPPRFPDDFYVNYEGYAEVEFIVDVDGNVGEVKIINSDWKRKRFSRNMRADPKIYDKEILRAVESWKYDVQSQPCRATTKITMEYK